MKYTTIEEVVATVYRRFGTGNLSAQHEEDVKQFISDAMMHLETTQSLERRHATVTICNNVGMLPCDYHQIIAVFKQPCKTRLMLGSDIRDFKRGEQLNEIVPVSGGVPIPTFGPDGNIYDNPTKLVQLTSINGYGGYYRLENGTVQTSFESGEVEIEYLGIPVDNNGYPLIPDLHSVKEAIYWFVVMTLIGAGVEHKVFKYGDAEARWRESQILAISDLKPFTPDHAERLRSLNTIVPDDRYNRASINSELRWGD